MSAKEMKTLTIGGVQYKITDENIGLLENLNTTQKSTIVDSINELVANSNSGIDSEQVNTLIQEYLEKNPPAAYTLPIATETTLGGVKAAAATEEMTQPVGITAEGKLVTVPGQNSGGNADQSGGGLSSEASALLITILRNGTYSVDQSANITALAAELAVTEEEEPDEPVVPDEPDTPEVTLSSISATYSGGDVAVGTAVSSLTGIVVTAHYSDGTSETVTGYTLSGTIAEGSNTITVSYGGKTTTFAVVGVAESSGEKVELTFTEVERVDMSVYSDNGATALDIGNYNATGLTFYTSNETFSEDTALVITRHDASSSAWLTLTICECEESNTNVLYNAIKVDDKFVSSGGGASHNYTVHAGRRLAILCRSTTNPRYTVTVTK